MNFEQSEKIAAILRHYGDKNQLHKCCEELAELQCELLKLLNHKGNLASIVDEMVDVIIMIEQLKLMLPVPVKEIEKHIDFKLDRTLERMKKQ